MASHNTGLNGLNHHLFNRIVSQIILLDKEKNEELELDNKIEELESDKERLSWIGSVSQEVNDAQSKTRHLFNLSDRKRGEIGLTDDYHMVILSLLKNFDRCMGATAIAEEWKINSGRVSRVFTASRRKFEVYKGHFEKCKDGGGYQFTKVGLDYALARGVPEILDVGLEDEQDT